MSTDVTRQRKDGVAYSCGCHCSCCQGSENTAYESCACSQLFFQTPNAVKKIKEILKDKTEFIGLKVGVRQRGCNGLSYTLDYATEKSKLDEEVIQDGVRVIIDRKAQLSLLGTEMDYIEDKLSAEFVFINPNIKGTCGCGESFSV
ncbi:iron-sulfur cluster assembly 1 homolog, mitochondrial isoform X1 [Cephus cinctus]|uniref:Iron-sulfur cluster assembly 1 homolog, mitochondrial n=1 Tax=Cephus cinctus TaxID=211228 RepID=A0AAJ7RNM9_CEPCN|nr:iron-sulfur cluster assembly 1 homolog, mitochondrial isoform X1 [Cephus cinctus]